MFSLRHIYVHALEPLPPGDSRFAVKYIIIISSRKLQLLHAHRDVPGSASVCADDVLMSHMLTLEWEILCCDICIVSTITPTVLTQESVAASPLASAFAQCLFTQPSALFTWREMNVAHLRTLRE